jgi:hypothetical protein
MLNLYYHIVIKNVTMAKKVKQKSQKSLKKTLLSQVEVRLSESLVDLPKKISEKKFKKSVRKAGKILTRTLATKPVKVASKSETKKSMKNKPVVKQETVAEAVS